MTRIALGGISLLTPLTGIGQYTSHLASELTKLNYDVELFLGHRWHAANPEFLKSSISPSIKLSLMARAWNKLKRQIPGARQTLHGLRQKTFTKGIGQFKHPAISLYHEPNFIPWETDLPTIATIHDLSWIRYPATHPADRVDWLNRALPKTLKTADHIVVVSDFVKQELLDVFGSALATKITRVYNGVSEEFHPRNEAQIQATLQHYQLQHRSYLLAVGTLEPRKNLSTILYAYAKLPTTIKDHFPLVLAGHRGWLNEELDQSIQAIDPRHIRLLGYVPQADLPLITAGAKAMIYGSRYEGFGLPTIEAMASGTPVISSSAKALKEVVGQAAQIVDPDDASGFQMAMQALIEDEVLCERYRQLGLERATQFNWANTAKETAQLYQAVLSQR